MLSAMVKLSSVHGDLSKDGYSIRTWQFHAAADVKLELPSGREGTVILINFAGKLVQMARQDAAQRTTHLGAGQVMVGVDPQHERQWIALGAGRHRGALVEVSERLLGSLPPEVGVLLEPHARPASERISKMPMALLTLAQQLSAPPAHAACLPVWFHAKVMELAAFTLFAPDQTMKNPPQSADRERLERAMFLLERDLENPPTLEMLADEVGCGAFHLSRVFGKLAGMTIPEFLRRKRMERAALLLRTTAQSVSEIALGVGYESFSAFTRGFVRVHGMTPSAYRSAPVPDTVS